MKRSPLQHILNINIYLLMTQQHHHHSQSQLLHGMVQRGPALIILLVYLGPEFKKVQHLLGRDIIQQHSTLQGTATLLIRGIQVLLGRLEECEELPLLNLLSELQIPEEKKEEKKRVSGSDVLLILHPSSSFFINGAVSAEQCQQQQQHQAGRQAGCQGVKRVH